MPSIPKRESTQESCFPARRSKFSCSGLAGTCHSKGLGMRIEYQHKYEDFREMHEARARQRTRRARSLTGTEVAMVILAVLAAFAVLLLRDRFSHDTKRNVGLDWLMPFIAMSLAGGLLAIRKLCRDWRSGRADRSEKKGYL